MEEIPPRLIYLVYQVLRPRVLNLETQRAIQSFIFLKNNQYPNGGIAQLVERLLCKQDVIGSNPVTSTI